jgi:hypothetical protein
MSKTLLIPSAVLVPDELKLDLGPIPTGMIPLDGKPAFDHIAQSYEETDSCPSIRRIIACDEGVDQIKSWQSRSKYEWEPVEVTSPSSLGDTIEQGVSAGIDRGLIDDTEIFIHFADTLIYPACSSEQEDEITFDYVDHPLRWTTFDATADGKISNISSKFTDGDEQKKRTFVGQFRLSNPYQFQRTLEQAVETSDNGEEPYYTALLEYLDGKEYSLRKPERWVDLGHLDTYYAARIEHLNTRGFNDLVVDTEYHTVKKRSENDEILSPEIRWYNNLPTELKPLAPRVLDQSTESDPYIKLEYIGYPMASDLYLYGNHGIHIWKTLFSSIFDVVDKFRSYEKEKTTQTADARNEMYLGKTISRLSSVGAQRELAQFFDADTVTVNGVSYPSPAVILERLEDDLQQSGLLDSFVPTLIHGDLSLTNILIDIRTHRIKLVDPRGEFGPYDIYGDFRYDLAKLVHSVSGQYEFIINDRFSVDVDDTSIEYSIWGEDHHNHREELFFSLLKSRYPQQFDQIMAIESLLWLSMIPLHSDAPDRQSVMLAQGIEKYSNVFIN